MSETTVPPNSTALANTAIGLGVATIIGVFTALGIQGDLLARMLRNEPGRTMSAFIFALVGVLAGLIGAVLNRSQKGSQWFSGVGVAFVCLGAAIAIAVGVASAGVRDQPTLIVRTLSVTPTSATDPTPTDVVLRVIGNGSFLASEDRMFLRIGGFPAGLTSQVVWNRCSNTAGDFMTVEGGDVLAAGESGPSTTGTTANTVTLRVSSSSYRYICAHAVLSPRPGKPDKRWVTTVVDLKSVGLDTTGSAATG